jgi:hypothetical protein
MVEGMYFVDSVHEKTNLSSMKDHSHQFPTISRIARDVLAIPGAISPVERLFSKSRHLCTDQRSSLAAATVTQSMCAKLWIRQGLFDFNK